MLVLSTRTSTWTLWYADDMVLVAAADVAVFVGTAVAALANDFGSGSSKTQKHSRSG
jgi:hypothetical protein